MKKNKKHVLIGGLVFLLIIAFVARSNILLHGYFIIGHMVGNTVRNLHETSNSEKPPQEDFISSALSDELNDKLFYDKKVEDKDDFGCTHYYFQITEYKKELITTITNTVNNSLAEYYKEEPDNIAPIEIQLYKAGRPYDTLLAKLSNYIYGTDICDSKLIALYIGGATGPNLYDYVCSYGSVKNIIQLELKKSIYDCIEDDRINVDWHKIFPDLEQFFVDGEKYINGRDYISDQNPNDSISKAIKNKLGNKIYYLGKDVVDTKIDYRFLIMDFRKELITDISDIINNILAKDYKNNPDKIPSVIIWLYVQTDDNSTTELASFSNFMRVGNVDSSKGTLRLIDLGIYDVLDSGNSYVHISNSDEIADAYNNANTYAGLKGIKSFTVNAALDESAKAERIDWYKVWPGLENYTVFPTTSPTSSPVPDWADLENFSTKPGSSSFE